MELVEEPTVYCISEPLVDPQEMLRYLREVGGEEWYERTFDVDLQTINPMGLFSESLIEFCGRLCYKSWVPGLNKNVTKIREDRGDYLLNILRSSHGSVLEHAHFTFVLHDVSRVLTAELNRHRAGVAISEQSLRYVRLDKLRFRIPEVLDPVRNDVLEVVAALEDCQRRWAKIMGLDDEGRDFHYKKTVTSALRRVAPLGLLIDEVWTANVRAIRHVIEMRTAPGAEEEIRIVAGQIARIMQTRCPLLFGDYEVSEGGTWDTEFRKV